EARRRARAAFGPAADRLCGRAPCAAHGLRHARSRVDAGRPAVRARASAGNAAAAGGAAFRGIRRVRAGPRQRRRHPVAGPARGVPGPLPRRHRHLRRGHPQAPRRSPLLPPPGPPVHHHARLRPRGGRPGPCRAAPRPPPHRNGARRHSQRAQRAAHHAAVQRVVPPGAGVLPSRRVSPRAVLLSQRAGPFAQRRRAGGGHRLAVHVAAPPAPRRRGRPGAGRREAGDGRDREPGLPPAPDDVPGARGSRLAPCGGRRRDDAGHAGLRRGQLAPVQRPSRAGRGNLLARDLGRELDTVRLHRGRGRAAPPPAVTAV
ncbi:MAG: Putrescine transport ATP-binding protein PotA, partial [uncultured Gemmatimonadetes bacterium]